MRECSAPHLPTRARALPSTWTSTAATVGLHRRAPAPSRLWPSAPAGDASKVCGCQRPATHQLTRHDARQRGFPRLVAGISGASPPTGLLTPSAAAGAPAATYAACWRARNEGSGRRSPGGPRARARALESCRLASVGWRPRRAPATHNAIRSCCTFPSLPSPTKAALIHLKRGRFQAVLATRQRGRRRLIYRS